MNETEQEVMKAQLKAMQEAGIGRTNPEGRVIASTLKALKEAEKLIASGRTHLGHSKVCELIRELERELKP